MIPARRASARAQGGEPGQRVGRRGAGRVGRDADPARFVRAGPPCAAANSSAAVAGEHEVRVAVDEAGDDAPAVGVEARVGIECAGGADRDDLVVLDRYRRRRAGARAGRRRARGSLVTSRPMLSMTSVLTHARAVIASCELASDVERQVNAVPHDLAAADDDVVHVGRARREHDGVERVIGVGAGQAARCRDRRSRSRPARRRRCARLRASRGWRSRPRSPRPAIRARE